MSGKDPEKEGVNIEMPRHQNILEGVLNQLGFNIKAPESSCEKDIETAQKHNEKQAETREVLKEASKETAKKGAGITQDVGAGVTAIGYVFAPVSAGLSLELVPVGTTIELVGLGAEVALDAIDGQYAENGSKIAITAGSAILSTKIKALKYKNQMKPYCNLLMN